MLKAGDEVPDFTVWAATREGKREFRLADHLGRGDIVFAFYPLAFTSTCTEQICETRDSLHFFEHVNAQPFGFSADTPHSNAAFAREQGIPFPLLSDPSLEVIPRIWETQTVSGVRDRPKRGVMVVDARGVVKHVWATDDPDEWPGLDEVKRVLHAHHRH